MQIIEIGHFLSVLALVLSGCHFLTTSYGMYVNSPKIYGFGKVLTKMTFIFLLFSFISLLISFVLSNFSLKIVYLNSHTLQPLIYKISALWGNHEGSMFLWVFVLSFCGYLLSIFGKNIPRILLYRALSIQGLLVFVFLLYILYTSNPFIRLFPVPKEGQGLNPLLQDIGIALHPPLLYIGYVGLSIVFSFSIAGLLNKRIDSSWAYFLRPWAIFAWIFLTAGIVLGSWWAYYELGWGGFWFWDPVENASFLPWLTTTALIHSISVCQKREALISWTLFLSIISFSFSLLGTFIVRSGIITSVHSFASDPTRGLWILVIFFLVVGLSLFLFALNFKSVKRFKFFGFFSRESILVINNLLLLTTAGIVLIGTLYPFFIETLTSSKISVGAPYFNKTAVPVMLISFFFMSLGPYFFWRSTNLKFLLKSFILPFIITITIILFSYILYEKFIISSFIGFFVSIFIIVFSLVDLFRKNLRLLSLSYYGMYLSHLGVAFFVIGSIGSTLLVKEKILSLKEKESFNLYKYELTLEEIYTIRELNYISKVAKIKIKDKNKSFILKPEVRSYISSSTKTTEASISSNLFYDIYLVLGDYDKDANSHVIRAYYKPFAKFLWLGGIMAVLGGLLCLLDNKRKLSIGIKKIK